MISGVKPLLNYILKRLLIMIPVVLGVTFVVFTIMYFTPGDPAYIMLSQTGVPSEEAVEALRDELGLNDSFFTQFGKYILGIVTRLDFGNSYSSDQPILGEIIKRVPTTVTLAALSVAVSAVIGIVAGVIAATKQYTLFDTSATVLSLVGVSMPNFWQGLMMILFFSVWLGWFPPSGFYGPSYWVLPVLTIGTSAAATVMRMTRSSMLEVVRQDYIRTAYAKGQLERVVIMRHALKNALIPIITVVGLQFGYMLGGSVLVETIFAIPGLGQWMVTAIKAKDYPAVQGGVLFIAVVFSFVNLFVDILYTFADPRIKTQYAKKSKRKEKGKAGVSVA